MDYTETFEQLKGLYPFAEFSHLRTEDNFAKKHFFTKKHVIATMLSFQKEPIPRSLFKLSTAYCGGREKSKALKNEAIELFKSLLGYTRDRYHPYPITLGQEIVSRAFAEPLLRDEIFCQLIKHTTLNPGMESLLLGWKLMYLCLSTFPPNSDELEKILLSHIAEIANPKVQKYIPFDTVENVASNCYMAILKIKQTGPRQEPPDLDEIRNLTVWILFEHLFYLLGI